MKRISNHKFRLWIRCVLSDQNGKMVAKRVTNVKTRLIDFLNLKSSEGIECRGTLSVSYHDKPPTYDDNEADFNSLDECKELLAAFTSKEMLDFIEAK